MDSGQFDDADEDGNELSFLQQKQQGSNESVTTSSERQTNRCTQTLTNKGVVPATAAASATQDEKNSVDNALSAAKEANQEEFHASNSKMSISPNRKGSEVGAVDEGAMLATATEGSTRSILKPEQPAKGLPPKPSYPTDYTPAQRVRHDEQQKDDGDMIGALTGVSNSVISAAESRVGHHLFGRLSYTTGQPYGDVVGLSAAPGTGFVGLPPLLAHDTLASRNPSAGILQAAALTPSLQIGTQGGGSVALAQASQPRLHPTNANTNIQSTLHSKNPIPTVSHKSPTETKDVNAQRWEMPTSRKKKSHVAKPTNLNLAPNMAAYQHAVGDGRAEKGLTGGRSLPSPAGANFGLRAVTTPQSKTPTVDPSGRPHRKRESPQMTPQTSPAKRRRHRCGKVTTVGKTWTIAQHEEEGPVACATRFVGDELQHGMWPSPFQTQTQSPNDDPRAAERQHKAHMKVVAASLEHFSRHVILPSMEKSCSSKWIARGSTSPTTKGNAQIKVSRTFFATLLALREVMTQNAESIFGKDAFDDALEEQGGSKTTIKNGSARRRKEHLEEDRLYCATLLATGVVLAAIKRYFPSNSQSVFQDFLGVVRSYDAGEEEFASCLLEDDGRSCGVLPNGKRLNKEENVASKVSFNRARQNHPLVRRSEERSLNVKRPRELVSVPQANVCVIAMVENLRDWALRPTGQGRL